MLSASSADRRNHIVVITDKIAQCDELQAILSQVCPVHLLSFSVNPKAKLNNALCVVIDVDLASPRAEQKVDHLSQLVLTASVPLIFVVDSSSEQPALDNVLKMTKAFGATNYITRPFKPEAILRTLSATYGLVFERGAAQQGGATGLGVAAAHSTLSIVLEVSRAKRSFTFDDVMLKDDLIFDALRVSGIKAWLETLRRHHCRTYRHSLLVTGIAVAFTQTLGMRLADQRRIAHAGLLHDVGKAFTPLSILDKPGKLTDDEMSEIKKHPMVGHELLVQQGGFPEEILDCVRHHHELLDGSGYPDGLEGEQIVDLVRIVTIADIFSALIEERSYKPPLPPEHALEIMLQMDGKLDADLLREFRSVALAAR